MANQNRTECGCYGNRWLYFAPNFDENDGHKLKGSWKPLARDWWSLTAPLERASAIAGKVCKPCTCNPDQRAPWAKAFRAQGSAKPAGEQEGGPFGA